LQNEHRQAEKDLALRVHKFGDWATSTSGGQQRQVSASSSTRACLVQNTPASIMALALIMSLCLTFPWTSFKKATPFMSVPRPSAECHSPRQGGCHLVLSGFLLSERQKTRRGLRSDSRRANHSLDERFLVRMLAGLLSLQSFSKNTSERVCP
jgi:hypothetical protein